MSPRRFDVLVVGAGPAGSIAALVLARAGAHVALLEKARFPRDKACGDLVGPRGLQLLTDLGLAVPTGLDVGDMAVVGPTGRRVVLPCFDGDSYPGRARSVTRTVFDDALRAAALGAGAVACDGRADRPLWSGADIDGFVLGDGEELRADFVIGADGATSRVAQGAGLVEGSKVLWGFAVRCYLEQDVALPVITLWEPARWRAFPGYGWLFPGPGGIANVGVGIGTRSDRQAGARAVRVLPAYLDHLAELGLLERAPDVRTMRRLGGWLKMGMVGTRPAAGRVLLAGDAAGLVNPLQGEGIAQAMTSGRAAAEAVLGSPGTAAARYRDDLARAHLPYQRITAAGHAALVGRPRAVAALGRLLTAPRLGDALAGGWGIFWNELLDGAAPGRARKVARASTWFGGAVTAGSSVSRWFTTAYPPPGPVGPPAPGGRR
ncbi:MAG TPA: geranylgeranyl reductase family protein [Acidimicrobiales bacterium]|nr:geranylgeranyl reductase family protein [Acidimicrobiales bacterium]